MDALDRLPRTTASDLRHLWMSTAREIAPRHVHRWLAQQTITDDDLRMLGHYGEQTPDKQKRSASAIANSINNKFGLSPANVVEIRQATFNFIASTVCCQRQRKSEPKGSAKCCHFRVGEIADERARASGQPRLS